MPRPRLELIITQPDEDEVEAVTKKMADLFSARTPSANQMADFAELYGELLEATAFDEQRVAGIIGKLVDAYE